MNFERKLEVCCEDTIQNRHLLQDHGWSVGSGPSNATFLYLNIWVKSASTSYVQHGFLIDNEAVNVVVLLKNDIDTLEQYLFGLKREWQDANKREYLQRGEYTNEHL